MRSRSLPAGALATAGPDRCWRVVPVFIGKLAPPDHSLRFDLAFGNSGRHGAAGFVGVGTVTVSARGRELDDLSKQGLDSLSGAAEMQRSHARRVDDPAASGDGMQ